METQNSKSQDLNLVLNVNQIAVFLKLIQSGFKLKIQTGLSIRELFCDQLGISDDYFDHRIQTIFLDGKPVDDEDTARVYNGARIALSAALPGLVGAVFRKGGRYASFRRSISHSEDGISNVKGEGEIVLKFFNLVAKELGPTFLQKGIIIEGKRFQNFVLNNSENLELTCTSIHLNDAAIDVSRLKETRWEDQEIFLQVAPETGA
ncbi:MAG: hypothetical protein PVG96_12235 [Desulfobacterales bacterium]|jgi:hypothetical protein